MFGRETEASVRTARCNTVFTVPEVVKEQRGASSPVMYTRSLMPLKNLCIRRLAALFGASVAM